jgi:transposase
MRKRKYSIEQKLEVCKDKEINNLSNAQLSLKYGIPKTNIRDWVKTYQELGEDAFKQLQDRKNNNSYTPDFRIALVKEKLNSNISYAELGRKYGINKCVIQSWVYKYEEKGEEALKTDSRGRAGVGRPPKSATKTQIPKEERKNIDKQLLDEVEHLRAEVAYLKKFNALVWEKQQLKKKKKL